MFFLSVTILDISTVEIGMILTFIVVKVKCKYTDRKDTCDFLSDNVCLICKRFARYLQKCLNLTTFIMGQGQM